MNTCLSLTSVLLNKLQWFFTFGLWDTLSKSVGLVIDSNHWEFFFSRSISNKDLRRDWTASSENNPVSKCNLDCSQTLYLWYWNVVKMSKRSNNTPCHLSLSLSLSLQDYPSLALLGEKLAENNIFLIFAVTKRLYVIYKVLWFYHFILKYIYFSYSFLFRQLNVS